MSLNNPNRIPEKYGLSNSRRPNTLLWIMRILGLGHMTELRLLNLLILTAGNFPRFEKIQTNAFRTPELF